MYTCRQMRNAAIAGHIPSSLAQVLKSLQLPTSVLGMMAGAAWDTLFQSECLPSAPQPRPSHRHCWGLHAGVPATLAGHRLAQGCPGAVHLLAQAVSEVQELAAQRLNLCCDLVACAANLHLVGLDLLNQALTPVLQLLHSITRGCISTHSRRKAIMAAGIMLCCLSRRVQLSANMLCLCSAEVCLTCRDRAELGLLRDQYSA